MYVKHTTEEHFNKPMHRWFCIWGIMAIESEKKMRKETKQLVGDAELVPFSFKHKDGGEVVKEAAVAYIPNLWSRSKSY